MVRAGTLINLALVGIVAGGIFLAIRNAGAIGSFIGGGLNQFGSNILGGINQVGKELGDVFTNTSPEQIVGTGGLEGQTEDVPKGGGFGETTPLQIGRLTFAQFLKDRKLGGTINISSGIFKNKVTRQPLDFTIDQTTGDIRTGRIGLSDAVLRKQAELSAQFGIPTFDIKGNLSTFGGVTSGKPSDI